jgi:hypothetical protein
MTSMTEATLLRSTVSLASSQALKTDQENGTKRMEVSWAKRKDQNFLFPIYKDAEKKFQALFP